MAAEGGTGGRRKTGEVARRAGEREGRGVEEAGGYRAPAQHPPGKGLAVLLLLAFGKHWVFSVML